jgi:hypothetical protein
VSVWERVCVECQAQETHNHSPSRHINTSNTHPHVHRFVQLIKGVLNRVLAPVSRCAIGMRALLPPSLSVAHPNVTSLQCRLTLPPRCGLLPLSFTRARAQYMLQKLELAQISCRLTDDGLALIGVRGLEVDPEVSRLSSSSAHSHTHIVSLCPLCASFTALGLCSLR